jgi:DNA gyrase/topoisomerase IV subunit A
MRECQSNIKLYINAENDTYSLGEHGCVKYVIKSSFHKLGTRNTNSNKKYQDDISIDINYLDNFLTTDNMLFFRNSNRLIDLKRRRIFEIDDSDRERAMFKLSNVTSIKLNNRKL